MEPYETTDVVTKQNIISQASPVDAINLCQADRRSRQACDSLPISEKVRICLSNDQNASKCDSIPMFSRIQFLSLIPPQIQVYEDDNLQLTHEFYPQNYKLSTEGFSVAMYKARLMNTICAAMRPEVLITYIDQLPPLPPYVNADVIDSIMTNYINAVDDPSELYQNIPNANSLAFHSRFCLRLALYGKLIKPRAVLIGNNNNNDPFMQGLQNPEPIDETERYSNRSYIDIVYKISNEGELIPEHFNLDLLDDPDPEDIERETAELNARETELDRRRFGIDGPVSMMDG